MNRKVYFHSVLIAALLLSAGAARAQRHAPGGPPSFGGPMELMGFEGLRTGQLVKGLPFSASLSSETTQTLQNGTVIHRASQGTVYRDSEGRSRKEINMSGFGPFAATGGTHTMISIADPVAGTHYMLDTSAKIAHKMPFRQHGPGASDETAQAFEQRVQTRHEQEVAAGLLKTESLGTQNVNGVNAEGTRVTRTIPVGEIGNDKPILVVSERWYSSDLQMVVKSTRSDPQFGITTYNLTNIQRTEPATTLFAVPSDYTVQTGVPRGLHGPGPGAPAMPPAPPDQD